MTHDPRDANSTFRGGARSAAMLSEINWASLSMLASTGILGADVCERLAPAMRELDEAQTPPATAASADYLDYETRLAALVGAEASLLHLGRSRQDIAATVSRMNLRLDALEAYRLLLDARTALVELARQHVRTIVPSYTHGVQAQPTTFAHYLLAFADAFDRQLVRIESACATINKCPLGAAAVTTSSFPIDRAMLARLLGFDGLIENSYDANHISPVDSCLELAAVMAGCAVQISQFAQDLHATCSLARPWIALDGQSLVGRSSLMPQKRNPAALEQLRAQSALLLSECQAPYYLAHNVRTGMFDYRAYDPLPHRRQEDLFRLLGQVARGIRVDADAAMAEIDCEFSTLTELADRLVQLGNIPFRTAHEFTSDLADLARHEGQSLKAIGQRRAAALYAEKYGQAFALTESEFDDCLDPRSMVSGRKGRGGPQSEEVERMLVTSEAALQVQTTWHRKQTDALADAQAALHLRWP